MGQQDPATARGAEPRPLRGTGAFSSSLPPKTFDPSETVPDACTLLSQADLTQILGTDPGAGSTRGDGHERSVCFFANGTITAVEIAGNYDASRALIEQQGRKTTDVTGVGNAAFFDPAGQLVARGDKVFVAVTAFGVDAEKLKAACAKMLAAAK